MHQNPLVFLRTKFSERRVQKRLAYAILALIAAYFLFRGCIPGLGDNLLPSDVRQSIQQRYTTCISPEDTPIWPGEPRQPECGRVTIRIIGKGELTEQDQAAGVDRAVCYHVEYESPRWTTQGTTRHEVRWSSRTASKVALRQNGIWQTFPDQDLQDQARWEAYACPGPFESASKLGS
jgi:hypothetical protein